MKPTLLLASALFALLSFAPPVHAQSDRERLAQLEKQFEDFRVRLKIPGMSVAIVKDQKVLWAKGFGYADVENRIPATAETLYPVASITKTFAGELVMQLVEQGKLDLEEPASHYTSELKDDSIKVKHLLSHTGGGAKPGESYAYNPEHYEYLTAVIEKTTGKSFRQVMVDTFLDPLKMTSSVPGPAALDEPRYAKNLAKYSQPYTLYGDEILHTHYPVIFFGASAGLLSTVLDLAKYDAALDRHVILKKATQDKAWANFISNSGKPLPYGYGWFVEDYHGARLIWHGGNWGTGFSAIYVKVPAKNLSLIMLSNSEALNSHLYEVFNGHEEATHDVFACSFLRIFVFGGAKDLDCERISQTALEKFMEKRLAKARARVVWDPLESTCRHASLSIL